MQRIEWLTAFALVAGASTAAAPTSRPSPAQVPETVAGSWRLISAEANGKSIDFPAGTTILKHVTPTDFMFVHYDQQGQITAAGGGRYRVSGTRYEETVDYGLGEAMRPLIGKTHVFTARIEKGSWHHAGTESDGTTIGEVWERVRPADSR